MTTSNAGCPQAVNDWLTHDLVECAPICIAVLDESLAIVFCNSNYEAVFGRPEGGRCFEVYKNRDRPCDHCDAIKTLKDGVCRVSEQHGVDCIGNPAAYVVHHSAIGPDGARPHHVVNMSYDVTERRAIQRQYNHLFERVPCNLSVIDRTYRIVRANEHARTHFGEVVGSHCYHAYMDRDEGCAECPARQTFRDGLPHSSRQVRRSSDGTPSYHVVSTAALPSERNGVSQVVEMSLDVTDVHALSTELEKESALRRHVTESALDALVACDEAGVVTIFNSAAERLFGVSATEVLRQRGAERYFPTAFCEAKSAGATSLLLPDTMVRSHDGKAIPVRFSGTVLVHAGKPRAAAGFFQDLREIKELERQKLANERLAAVGQTVTQLAHSIKNILTGLQGGLYDIRTGWEMTAPDRTEEGLNTAERGFQRIRSLVRDFLRFSKDHLLELEHCDPNEVAQEVYDLYRKVCQRRSIALRLHPLADPPPVRLDVAAIHTCLANLVSNAIDACVASGTSPCAIDLTVRVQADRLRFEVTDTGCGMDEALRSRLFSGMVTTKGMSGTGLGLLMTKKIIEDHGGTIEVQSTPGAGSSFIIELPESGGAAELDEESHPGATRGVPNDGDAPTEDRSSDHE